MNTISELDISSVLNGFYRRKNLIVATLLVVASLATYLAVILPDVFRSSTLIVVSPQRVPASFVASTVTMDVAERIQSIIQEILSRTQLEKIINEFQLSPMDAKGPTVEDRVESLRKKIKIEVRRNNVFQMSYESASPEKAKQVTSKLASLFVDQNLQVREEQAVGTKTFINAETDRLRKELEEQESVVNQYKAANLYELPDQLSTNLRGLEQLQREFESTSQRLSALQERKGVLQKQSVESDILGVDLFGGSTTISTEGETQNVQLAIKKRELDSLLQRYSSKHPDVTRLRREIDALEAESKGAVSATKSTPATMRSSANPLKQVLQTQISDLDSEIQALRAQSERVRNQMGGMQARVDKAPLRSIELSKISRGYEITLRKFQDLLAKGLDSELSENMEKKQKGEQFQILDPANFPLRPERPNRLLIVALGIALGLGGGLVLALLWDNLDTSFKRSDEVYSCIDVPLLATLPALITRGSVVEQRRSQGLLVVSSIGVLAVGLVLVRVFGPLYF